MDKPTMARGALVSGSEIENLPSFGVSSYFNLVSGADTAKVMKQIRDGKDPSTGNINDERFSPKPGPSGLLPPTTTNNQRPQIQVFIENTKEEQDPDDYDFKFAAGTAPVCTVDETQIMEEKEATKEPVLVVKMTSNYLRFRYMSEKCPKKRGPKARSYEADDADKHCLCELWVNNYTGAGKIVGYCVDINGKLHPYNLYGENCHNGVYVSRFKFRPGKIAKLQKVSITTPKAKEYVQNLKNQLAYLEEVGIRNLECCDINSIQDKQVVYVMFKVILDDLDKKVLSQISTPLQNKKRGREFLIEDIEPVSAPASGEVNFNILRNRVMLHVTENTAFPSEVGIKIRERDAMNRVVWEVEPAQVLVVKQCVVKFIPPPYQNPHIREDVEVEVCLYDKATSFETDPVKFTYRGSDNLTQELESKAKKRKLDEDAVLRQTQFMPEKTTKGQRKILSALRTRPASSSPRNSDSSSPENSLTYISESQPVQTSGLYTTENQTSLNQAVASGTGDRAVSVRQQRTAEGQLPFTSYIAGPGQNVGHSIFGSGSPQRPETPQSAGFNQSSGASSLASLNQSSVVTSTVSVFSTTQQTATYQTATAATPPVSINSNMGNPTFQSQQQMEQSKLLSSQPTLISKEDQLFLAQQGAQLPKLGPNQMFALIDGQIFVVNDDTAEPRSSAAPEANPPYPSIQNLGQQQVIVQHMEPQQPTETQRHSNMPRNWSPGTVQSQTEETVSQTVANSQVLSQLQQQILQQQQQQQAIQLAQQIAVAAGIDLSQPGQLENILQQLIASSALQQASVTGNEFNSNSDLNDDDVEIDGSPNTETNVTDNGQLSHSEQRNKNLGANNINENDSKPSMIIEIVPTGEDASSRIPTFVSEVTIGDESSDSISYADKPTRKHGNDGLRKGSFGNGETSGEEDGV